MRTTHSFITANLLSILVCISFGSLAIAVEELNVASTSSLFSKISLSVTATTTVRSLNSPSSTTCVEDNEEDWVDWNSWESTKTTTSLSSSITPPGTQIPSGCPFNNGSLFKENADKCSFYQRVCGRSYAEADFLPFNAGYNTAEECTGLCDALNRGTDQSCLGIVWTTTSSTHANCRALRSLSMPVEANNSIALLIEELDDPSCPPKTSTNTYRTTTPVSSTTSSSIWMTFTITSRTLSKSTSSTVPFTLSTESSTMITKTVDTTTLTIPSTPNTSTTRTSSISSVPSLSTSMTTATTTNTIPSCPITVVTITQPAVTVTITMEDETESETCSDPETTTYWSSSVLWMAFEG